MMSTSNREDIPNLMKCIVYGQNGVLESKMVQPPSGGRRNHVLVKVHAVGLNPVDAKEVVGDKLPYSWKQAHKLVQWYIRDKVPGFDFCGTVVEDSCPTFEYGTAVFGDMPPFDGSLAEYVSVPLDQVAKKPQALSMEEAAALPLVGLTALQAMHNHHNSMTSVLVVGASGGTGHVACQVARNLGATHVTAICSGRNAEMVTECGATHVVDYTRAVATADMSSEMNENELVTLLQSAPGCPYSFVMDCVTSADPRDQVVNYPQLLQARKHGLLQLPDYIYRRLGGPSPDWIRAGAERLLGHRVNCFDANEKLFWIRFPKSSEELRQLQEWADEGKLTPKLSHVYEFNEESVREAFDAILSRRVKGKVAIRIANQRQR